MATKRKAGKKATGNLLSLGDIAKIANTSANTVQKWSSRDIGFPTPVDGTTASKLYSRGSIMRWLKKTSRI